MIIPPTYRWCPTNAKSSDAAACRAGDNAEMYIHICENGNRNAHWDIAPLVC